MNQKPIKTSLLSSGSFLIAGQILLATSTFFWKGDGRYSLTASVLIFFSMLLWTIGFMGLFDRLKSKSILYARLGLLYAIYGVFGGVAFAFEGAYSEIFHFSGKMGVEASKQYPLEMNLLMFWSGPAFPLSLLILGIVFVITKSFRWWVGASISLGGFLFPLGRILRSENEAHLSDLVLLIAVFLIALESFKDQSLLDEKTGIQ